jgi:CDP-diacylglycerol--serine O-phosphatidyltransferase
MTPVLRFLDVVNGLTLVSLAAALACALLAVNGRPAHAAAALVASGLCDLFDGWVARRLPRTDEQRRFGGRLDSVVDACAFGFAPVVLLYCSGLTSPAEVGLLLLFACCAVWRLAYFDAVTAADGPWGYHEGLPTTYAALVLRLAYLLGFLGPGWLRGGLCAATAGLAVGMVSTWRIPKPRGAAYVLFLLAGLVSIGVFLVAGNAYGPTPRP